MHIGHFLPILLVTGTLVAWIHEESSASSRIVVLESLSGTTAAAVVPAFEAALAGHLAIDGRLATFVRLPTPVAGHAQARLREKLHTADLVVSFGAEATVVARASLQGSAIPHLFAFVPRGLAQSLAAPTADAFHPAVTGLTGQLSGGAAFAIADRLLASRDGAPLRIGFVHQAPSEHGEPMARLAAAAGQTYGFIPVPFVLGPGPEIGATLASVKSAVLAAMSSENRVEAFWLALEPSAPLDLLVQSIEAETGLPVIYAPSEAAVAAGALMSLAPEPASVGREAAALALRLLDGAPASAIPLRAPFRVELALNLGTAESLGLVPPHELLQLARGRLFW